MRKGELSRKTFETDINISLNLDGSGKNNIDTGVGFLDHMLQLFSCHGNFDINLKCYGDVKVDFHHTVEDIGILIGKLIYKLLGDKKGINRFATSFVPMDESLTRTVIDISGRPFIVFKTVFSGKIGEFDAELIEEFFRAVAFNSYITLHMETLYGSNQHHMAEGLFKSFAKALSFAVKVEGDKIPSSKGIIE